MRMPSETLSVCVCVDHVMEALSSDAKNDGRNQGRTSSREPRLRPPSERQRDTGPSGTSLAQSAQSRLSLSPTVEREVINLVSDDESYPPSEPDWIDDERAYQPDDSDAAQFSDADDEGGAVGADEEQLDEKDEDPHQDIPANLIPIKESNRFRIRSSTFAWTYLDPDNKLTLERLLKFFRSEFIKRSSNPLKRFLASREVAPSTGTTHYHGFVSYTNRLDVRNPRNLDVDGCHPNVAKIGKGRDNLQRWIEYTLKDGTYLSWPDREYRGILFKDSLNFTRRMADHNQWVEFNESRRRGDPYPFCLPDGTEVNAPDPSEKKSSYYILGTSNTGKTTWWRNTFRGKRVYIVPDGDHQWDGYNGEPVVIFDDIWPQRGTLFRLTEDHRGFSEVVRARYNNRRLPDQRVTVILISNPKHQPSYAADHCCIKNCWDEPEKHQHSSDFDLAFWNRFNFIDMDDIVAQQSDVEEEKSN